MEIEAASSMEANFSKVTEGKAQVYFLKDKNQVFYNPIQEFNRDLSIAALNTYSATNGNKRLRILEALAASGIRSVRYSLEIANCERVLANDFDKKAVELIEANIKLNQVEHTLKSSYDDATSLMNVASKSHTDRFDAIDLDPYGSPANFLDSAIRAIKSGGMLLVTATDAGVLCGNGVDTCYTKYGALSARAPCCHELALRILLQSINSHAIRYSKYVVPLLSLSIDFYFRLFVLVYDSQLKAKESVQNIGYFYICACCHSFYQQDFGKSVPTSGNVKFVPNNEFMSSKCPNCSGNMRIAGPLWTGSLHDTTFVNKVIEHVNTKSHCDYATKDRILGMLHLAAEELPNPLYYVLDDICSVMHCETPNHKIFRSVLMNAGFHVSYSHCNKNSIKTNAPTETVWNILKEWIKTKPIKEKWLTPEYRVFEILKKPSEQQFDFTIRKECFPLSKVNKLVRYHDPPPFWGPKSKPKRKQSENEDSAQNEKPKKTTGEQRDEAVEDTKTN